MSRSAGDAFPKIPPLLYDLFLEDWSCYLKFDNALIPEMGVPPLRGPFQTPKIGVGGSVARILQYGSAFGPASGTGQTSKCNQPGRK